MSMFYILDIFGTFIFGLSGAFRAVKYELDLLGVLILSIITGVGGGMVRDTLLGTTPAAALKDENYLIATIVAGLLVFFFAGRLAFQWKNIIRSDALGLGVFTAIGVTKALEIGMGPVGAIIIGVLTATGGGVIRDMLVRETPAILEKDFYATASIIGGALLVLLHYLGAPPIMQIIGAIAMTTTLRLIAIQFGLSLPKVKKLDKSPSNY